MTTFHEGQDVEVAVQIGDSSEWRKAKIIKLAGAADLPDCGGLNWYEVQFLSHAIFDENRIRAASPLEDRIRPAPKLTEAEHQAMLAGDSAEEYPALADPDDDTSDPMGSEVSP